MGRNSVSTLYILRTAVAMYVYVINLLLSVLVVATFRNDFCCACSNCLSIYNNYVNDGEYVQGLSIDDS